MSQKIINIGQAANDKSGDPLRLAFDKVNQNFTELYARDVSTQYHLGDDVQFVDIDPDTGTVVIQSGYDTGMPVYIKGGNCADGGVGGNVVIEAGGPPLGELITGTVGNVEIAGNDITIDAGGGVTTFASGDGTPYVTFPAVNGSQLGIQGSEISSLPGSEGLALSAREGPILLATHGDQYPSLPWTFDRSGTINTPLLFPLSFTAVLDVAHRTVGTGTYSGPAWEFNLEWQVAPNGEIECLSDNGSLPSLVNGYADGQTFEFTEADHGIPDYTLSIELYNVVHAGPAGWTANLTFSAPPAYPSTINSQGAIKLTSNENSWVLGTDGNLTLPGGGLVSPNGYSNLSTTSSVWAVGDSFAGLDWKGTNTLYADSYGIEIYTNSSGSGHTSGDENYWKFGTDGNLSLPAGGVIKNSDGSTYGGGGGGISISDFGEGFSLNGASKIVTNKLYSTNLTQPNQHYRLELDTNGVVHLPDQSIINGATLKSVAGNYAGITAGPVGKDEDSWVWVDDSGTWIATDYSDNAYQWHFDNTGNLTVPGDIASTAGVGPVVIEANDGTVRTWTFDGDGRLTLPGELYVKTGLNGAILGDQSTTGLNINVYEAAGFALNWNTADTSGTPSTNPEPGNPAFSTDNSSVEFGWNGINLIVNGTDANSTWTFGPTGILTFPDTNLTIENSTIGRKSVTIFDDGLTHTEDVEGSRLAFTDTSTSLETYNNPDGPNNTMMARHYTNGSAIAGLEVYAEDLAGRTGTSLYVTGGGAVIESGDSVLSNTWNFESSGDSVVPGKIKRRGSVAELDLGVIGTDNVLLKTTDDVSETQLLLSALAGASLTTNHNVLVSAGSGGTILYNIWLDAETMWELVRDQDAQIIAPDTRPWAGMPSYLAYPEIMNYTNPPGVLPPSSNMAPTAHAANLAYEAWQEEVAATNVSVSVTGNNWEFGSNGQLTVPGAIRRDGILYLNSNGDDKTSSVVVHGDQGRVFVRTIDGATQNEWYFKEDGSTTFPNGEIKSPVTPQVGAFVTNLPDYDQVSDNNYIWVKAGPALVPVSELISRIGDMTGCIFTNNLGVEYTVIQDNSPNSTGSLNLVFDNALPAGHIYTVRSPDYSEKIAPALNVNVDENIWTFGNDGIATFPDDTTIGASSIKFANNSSLGISNAAYDAALAGWEFIRGGEITDKINNNLVTAEGWPMVNWHPTGITASGYIDFLTMARAIQNSGSGAPLIIYPAMSTEFYNQMRSALIAIQYSYNLDSTAVSISSGYAKHWNFSEDGKITLPAGGDIVDSEGETVLGFAASYLSGYTVLSSDPGGITVIGDVTSTFSTGQIIKFSTLNEDEYTIDVVTYDSGSDWTTIILVEGLGGPVNGDTIYFEKYNVSEIYPGDGIYATLMNNVLTLGTTGAYYPSNPSDWDGDAPTTITQALDRLAAVVKVLNGGTGA